MVVVLSQHVMGKIERTFGEYEYLSRQIRMLLGKDGSIDALGLLMNDQARQSREMDLLLERMEHILLRT